MRALIINECGGPEKFMLAEVPIPELGDYEVLIENYSTSVNPIDWKVRAGVFKDVIPLPFPIIIGHDVAGVVSAVGSNVTKWKRGDRVFAKNKELNAFAEFVAVDENIIAAVPETVSFNEAASVGTAGVAAYKSLFHFGNIKKGQKILIHGGAGGVGSLTIQLAKNEEALVAATASTGNIEFLKSLGVDVAIDYTKQDFTREIDEYDLVIDLIGGDVQKRSFGVLKSGGTLVSVSQFSEEDQKEKIKTEVLKAIPDADVLQKMINHIENGELKTIITEVLPFEEKALQRANAKIEMRHGRGKMVVQIKNDNGLAGKKFLTRVEVVNKLFNMTFNFRYIKLSS